MESKSWHKLFPLGWLDIGKQAKTKEFLGSQSKLGKLLALEKNSKFKELSKEQDKEDHWQ